MRTTLFLGFVTTAAGVAAGVVLLSTSHWGVGVTPDSVAYLDAAQNLRHGRGLEVSGNQPLIEAVTHRQTPYPLLFWAPAYPTVLAGAELTGMGLLSAARIMNVVLMAGIVLLVGLLVRQVTRSDAAGLTAAIAVAVSPVALELYSEALSEPLFVLLSFSAVASVCLYVSLGTTRFLWLSAALTSFALVTRFAGLPLLLATLIPLGMYGQGSLWPRLRRSAAYLAVSLLPLGAWLIRNMHLTGSASGRHLGWHPVTLYRLEHGLDELTMLVLPPNVPATVRGPIALVLVSAFCAAAWRLRQRLHLIEEFDRALLTSLAIYLFSYPLFLLVSISFFDELTNLSHRFLFPVFPAMIVIAGWITLNGTRSASYRRVGNLAVVSAITALVLANAAGSAFNANRYRRSGLDYTSASWRNSPAIRRLAALPTEARIHTDRPELVYFLIHRRALGLPAMRNPMSGELNAHFRTEVGQLKRGLTGKDWFVFFARRAGDRWYLASPEFLARQLRLRHERDSADARFYRACSRC